MASLQPKSPAEEAGLKRGDLILTVDDKVVDDPEAFGYRFALKGISGSAKFGILRGTSRSTISVKPRLGSRDTTTRGGEAAHSLAHVRRHPGQHFGRPSRKNCRRISPPRE